MSFEWPNFFPTSCPPDSSEWVHGEIYRLVKSSGPSDEDFKTFAEKRPQKDYGKYQCQACGLSVFRSLENCITQRRLIPALKKKSIAKADLKPEHGACLNTPSNNQDNHYTWWMPASLKQPATLFEFAESR